MSGEPAPLVSGADIRTFLFADMRGYTRFTQEQGDDAASALAGRFADLVRERCPSSRASCLSCAGMRRCACFARPGRRSAPPWRCSGLSARRVTEVEPFPLGVGMGLDCGEAVATQGGYAARL